MITASVSHQGEGLSLRGRGSAKEIARRLRDAGVTCRRNGNAVVVPFEAAPTLLSSGLDVQLDSRAERAIANRTRIRESAPAVLAEMRRIRREGAGPARARIADCRLLDRLDDHQAVNVALMTEAGGWGAAIFDEQGTGKTITTIAAFDLLVERQEADAMVVVAPKSMVGTWIEEINRFTGDLYKAVALGPGREAGRQLLSGADVLVMNYERAVALLPNLELLARRSRVILVVDESYNVKNPAAIRTSALTELREWCSRAFVLCGTPAPNAPADMLSQVDLTDFGYTFKQLQDREEVDAEAVSGALAARSVHTRNLKRQVLPHLPERSFSRVSITLATEQARLYESGLDSLIGAVGRSTPAAFIRNRASYLERRTALLRVCSNPRGLDPSYQEVPAKLASLDELLPELVGAGEKVVLWSFFRVSLDELSRRYERYGLVRVDGSIADASARHDAVRRFQEDDDTWLFVGNPAAAGAGLSLHRARVAVYESLSNQAAHYLQSLDRIHRRGQDRSVEYITLLCSGTIEEVEYDRLLHKAEAQASLLGDPPESPVTRDLMLEELLALRRRLRKGGGS